MSAVPKTTQTVEQYLAIEQQAEFKSEFFQGEMFAMAGASRIHNRVKENLIGELYIQLRGGPCHSASSDQRVMVQATGLYTYPDIVIECGSPELDPSDQDTITNPTAIIEVLSSSTESYNRGAKFRNYQKIPSLKEYVLVAQDEAVVESFTRQPNGIWHYVSFVGLDSVMMLSSIPVRVPLKDIYAGVQFPGEGEA
jgi:Uma2 family endonuclease